MAATFTNQLSKELREATQCIATNPVTFLLCRIPRFGHAIELEIEDIIFACGVLDCNIEALMEIKGGKEAARIGCSTEEDRGSSSSSCALTLRDVIQELLCQNQQRKLLGLIS